MHKYLCHHPSLTVFLTVFLVINLLSSANAQDRCGVVEYEKLRKLKNPYLESEIQFEKWIQSLMIKSSTSSTARFTDTDTLIIPVVVHVIHNGEAVGSGSNISAAQVLSQIEVLNEDYRRKNADTTRTPVAFKPVAADTKIEFRLAKRDPEGLATSGIVRARGTRNSWEISEYQEMKALSYWPAEDYMNIWVAPLEGNLIGYAQLPFSDLPGIIEPSNNRLTDGVVISYKAFGSSDKGNFPQLQAPYNKGRTTTHEVGHFFGLRHIWGDGGCDVDDYCSDTPNAGKNYTGCPTSPSSCGSIDMVQNFLDYTDDVCMNIFTQCQRTRMRAVLANSPRRKSLLESKGTLPPEVLVNDAGIRAIKSPLQNICEDPVLPIVTIRNYGSNKLNTIKVDLYINQIFSSSSSKTISLNPLETVDIQFESIDLPGPGKYQFTFTIAEVNGGADSNLLNNNISQTLIIPQKANLPVSLNFNTLPGDWIIVNPDSGITWSIKSAGGNGINNKGLFINFFRYENGQGEFDYFISPTYDFTDITSAQLSFKVAYAFYSSNSEGLTVKVSTDCGNTFNPAGGIFSEFGRTLSTYDTTDAFNPKAPSEWKTVTLDLTPYAGQRNVQIAFIAQNAFGNNLYIDDLKITGFEKSAIDLALESILSPSLASCDNSPEPKLKVTNMGLESINSFTIDYTIDSLIFNTYAYSGPPLVSGANATISLPAVQLSDGDHFLDVIIKNPNSKQDEYPVDNYKKLPFVIDARVAIAPYKESFSEDNLISSKWSAVSIGASEGWGITTTSEPTNNKAAFIENFGSGSENSKNWLVSPILNLEYLSNPRLNFKYSYAYNRNFEEQLHVIVSTDCGNTFSDTIFSRAGADLAVVNGSEPWSPVDTVQWLQSSINISAYAGKSEVRMAFVFTGNSGNNIYIDDIEVTSGNNIFRNNKLKVIHFFDQPGLFLVTFNVQEQEEIDLTVADAMGRIITKKLFLKASSESYELNLSGNKPGVYLIIATSKSFRAAQKVVILE